MANPDSFPPYYKRGMYDMALRTKNPRWVAMVKDLQWHGLHKPYKPYMFNVGGIVGRIKDLGKQQGWGEIPKPNAVESRSNPYKLVTGYLKHHVNHSVMTEDGERQYQRALQELEKVQPSSMPQMPSIPSTSTARPLSTNNLRDILDNQFQGFQGFNTSQLPDPGSPSQFQDIFESPPRSSNQFVLRSNNVRGLTRSDLNMLFSPPNQPPRRSPRRRS